MPCAECNDLAFRRDLLWKLYSDAVAVLNAAYASTNAEQFVRLRAEADEARIQFNMAETEFRRHQDRHAGPD